ncbi:MAG: OmpH family outer membrane protein [Chthoniobacteraceae bacterium]
MKLNLILPALAAVALISAAPMAQADVKIGYVDMNRIFNNYYKTEQAKKRVDEAQAVAQKELQDRADVFNKNLSEVKKLNDDISKPELSKDAKEKKTKDRDLKAEDVKRQEKDIMELRQKRLKELQEQAARMRSGIVEEIRKVIADKVKADQYDLVLDKSGLTSNGIEVVLYSREAADFSDDIIKVLNKNKDAAASATPSDAPKAADPLKAK